jgi:hypothetical protein
MEDQKRDEDSPQKQPAHKFIVRGPGDGIFLGRMVFLGKTGAWVPEQRDARVFKSHGEALEYVPKGPFNDQFDWVQPIPPRDETKKEDNNVALFVWKNTDPRHDLDGMKHAEIVILRPHLQGNSLREAGMGYVEMKHGWYVHTSFAEHPSVHEDDQWDQDWLWTLAPTRKTQNV